jgi:hypothetical protein
MRCCLSVYRTLLECVCRSVIRARRMHRSLRDVALETVGIPGGMVVILGEVLDETLVGDPIGLGNTLHAFVDFDEDVAVVG